MRWYHDNTLSGYKLPWVPNHSNGAKFHDDHHRLFNKNYGGIGFLDWFHGTLEGPGHFEMWKIINSI